MLNVTKRRETVVDFKGNRTLLKKITIQGGEVQVVDEYKCVGVPLDNKLDRNCNTKAVYKKRTMQTLLLEEAEVLKCMLQDAAYVLQVYVGKYIFLCSPFAGAAVSEPGTQDCSGTTGAEGQEEDAAKTAPHIGRYSTSTTQLVQKQQSFFS